jgi:hypothetical protein
MNVPTSGERGDPRSGCVRFLLLLFFFADHQSRPAAIFVLPFNKALRLCHVIRSRDEGK